MNRKHFKTRMCVNSCNLWTILTVFLWTKVISNCVFDGIYDRAIVCPVMDWDGCVVSPSYLLWSKTDREMLMHCAADCYRDQRCQAFFYNNLTLVCQGHSNSSLSIADAVPEDGWVHHRYCSESACSDERLYSGDDFILSMAPPDELGLIRVFCDMQTGGGGWLVFQRRKDGSVDFAQLWDGYKTGFGDLGSEFWLGNDNIHRLTSQRSYKLRIDMADFEGDTCTATYSQFSLASEEDLYMLFTGGFSGECGNGFTYGNGRNFSTIDRDNDVAGINCADRLQSGWWFGKCHSVNLNGQYNNTAQGAGINWNNWRGYYYSLKSTEMKLRPV